MAGFFRKNCFRIIIFRRLVFIFLFSAAAVAPKKKIQTTLTNLVVKGTDLILQETQQKLGNFVSFSILNL